ncbi:multidrug resistance-associated protein 1 [Sarcoptes scabiei]|nr:multidrug resistance-associated protein 1 [Sarcoptes scabiei]
MANDENISTTNTNQSAINSAAASKNCFSHNGNGDIEPSGTSGQTSSSSSSSSFESQNNQQSKMLSDNKLKKLNILQFINKNKEILFTKKAYKLEKEHLWKQTFEMMRESGMVSAEKDWRYVRDVSFSNWRKRAQKRLKNLSANGFCLNMDECEFLISDLLGKTPDRSTIRFMNGGQQKRIESESSSSILTVRDNNVDSKHLNGSKTDFIVNNHRKFNNFRGTSLPYLHNHRKIPMRQLDNGGENLRKHQEKRLVELEIENKILKNRLIKLKVFELEQNLGFDHCNEVRDLVNCFKSSSKRFNSNDVVTTTMISTTNMSNLN